ncbi:uncharacterized protein [Aegilops tauschii subsp. strangulata]|uniref:uncharacterized protein isoform X2 n=1 Tax=Aegilops tauschii subsp. strangulata TaxID=200361 RepID=UPI001E1CA76B|nr:flowering time control protein FPA-like isoform X2 [Aegilops tauschii subsp. strangulata]
MSSDPSSVEPSVAMEVTKPSASPSKESEPVGVRAAAAVAATQVAAHEKNALWVGNLPAHVGEDDVVASFAPHKTLDCVIMRIEYRSNAFIIFRSIAECRTALKALRGSNIKSAFILIEFAQPWRHNGSVATGWSGGESQVAGGSSAQSLGKRGA